MREQSRAFGGLPVLKLLTEELPWVGSGALPGDGPVRAACGPEVPRTQAEREMRGALWEVAPTRRNERRIKAGVAQDRKCMPFW